jgi:hypothetical protein
MPLLKAISAWFTTDKSLAVATWGLVVATFLLVLDGWQKSREQGRSWKRDDERRKEEAKPRAIVELATDADGSLEMFFACFNLGNNTFFIDKLIVTASDGTMDEASLTPKIVIPGTYVTIGYDPSQLLGLFGEATKFKEANGVLVLKGATATATTEPVWFYVGYGHSGYRCEWGMGRLADRKPGMITKFPKILPDLPKQRTTL